MNYEQFVNDIKTLNRQQLKQKYNNINYWKKKFKIEPKDDPFGRHDPINKMPLEQFACLVKSSVNFADAKDKIGLKGSSAAQRIKKRCEQDGIDFSHINLDNPCKTKRSRYRDMPELNQRQTEIVIGSLLGDGSLGKIYGEHGQSAFEEGHGVKQKDYLFWKYNELLGYFKNEPYEQLRPKIDIDENGKIFRLDETEPCWIAKTMACPVFTSLERKWYLRDRNGNYIYRSKKRVKIIPQDLQLTPLIVAIWYCDDGCLDVSRKTVTLATNGFSVDEVTRLSSLLESQYGINARMKFNYKGKPLLHIYSDSFLDFFKLIEESQPDCDCMNYKFDLSAFNPISVGGKYVADDVIEQVLQNAKNGKQQKQIAKELDLSEAYVCGIVRGKIRNQLPIKQDGLNYRNTSGSSGVNKYRKCWIPRIKIGEKNVHLGCFDSIEEATQVRRIAEQMKSSGIQDIGAYKQLVPSRKMKLKASNKSGLSGVHKKDNSWIASIAINGRTLYLGSFNNIETAALVRRRAEEMKMAGNSDVIAYRKIKTEFGQTI